MLKQVIQNIKSPICNTCKYYKPFTIFKNSDNLKYSLCMRYGEKNIITGEVKFEFAGNVRKDEKKCGSNGIYHEKKKWII